MNRIVLSLLLPIACLLSPARAADTTDLPGESPKQHNARMEWWRDARFGMFIHWGLYSQAAGYWNGQPTQGAGEWIMTDVGIPRAQYATLAPQFDPVKFDADQWAEAAHNAGMKYLVITSKHHEGFRMFKTAATDYNVVDGTPWHEDPLAALSKACRRHGINPAEYLQDVFERLPKAKTSEVPALTPAAWSKAKRAAARQSN